MKGFIKKIGFLFVLLLLVDCSSDEKHYSTGQDMDVVAILSALQQSADLVTTELTVRKIAIYDTKKSEPFRWTDPHTWKYGDQKCMIPVEVHLKYGFDLSAMRVEDIQISADSSNVVIHLPQPKIIDAGYNTYIDDNSIVKMSTGLRSEVGHALEEEIRKKGYEAVLSQDLTPIVGDEVKRNAQTLFSSMLQAMGWKHVAVLINE